MTDLLDSIRDSVAHEVKEAKAETASRHKPISYWCSLFENCSFSPQEFYMMVERSLARRQVPDLRCDCILMHEGTLLSKRRLYYRLRRERIEAEICAAPFGSGFFVSSRLFDRRRTAFFWDYIIAVAIPTLIVSPILVRYGPILTFVMFGTLFTTLWSLMRLATSDDFGWLDDWLAGLPCVGPIYETWFFPKTYFREDQHNMYREAVNRSVREAIAELTAQQGLRPLTELESRPILPELR